MPLKSITLMTLGNFTLIVKFRRRVVRTRESSSHSIVPCEWNIGILCGSSLEADIIMNRDQQ